MPQPSSGIGNVALDPLFVDFASGDLRLQFYSPCVNAGLNANAPGPTDLDGKPRIVGDAVDIGAYEFEGSRTVATHYVDADNPNPLPPYSSWATAAQTIQDAVDAASYGDEVLVTNGTYATGGRVVSGTITIRVAVDKPIRVRTVNGPSLTAILGHQVPGFINGESAIRCVYLTNGASLSGFTLKEGATQDAGPDSLQGGGVWCASASAVISNCVVTSNAAFYAGGGVYSGTLYNCAIFRNSDADGMNNWQEWVCATDPTNPLSVLCLLPPAVTRSNVTLTWQSVPGLSYFLERSTNLDYTRSFVPMATNLLSQPSTNLPGQGSLTSFKDTNVAGALRLFYRVGVKN